MNLGQMVLRFCPFFSCCSQWHEQLDDVVDDLHPTEDGEAGEEPHGAADEAELGLQGHLHIPLYLIIGGRVEVDVNRVKRCVGEGSS